MSIKGKMDKLGLVSLSNGQIQIKKPVVMTQGGSMSIGRGGTYYVDSNNGSASADGKTSQTALTTLAAAIAKCTANQGDKIYLLPGHAETVASAAAINANVAGITIVGLGEGADRPTFTFSATASTITVTAASIAISNIILKPSIGSVVSPIVVSAADCVLDVEVQDASDAVEFVRGLLTTAAADRLTVNMKYIGRTGGNACDNAIRLVGCNDCRINIDFYGKAATAVVEFHTTACTNVVVSGSMYVSGTTDSSKNVVDSVEATPCTWFMQVWDGSAGAEVSGGSGNAVAAGDLSVMAANIVTLDTVADGIQTDLSNATDGLGALKSLIDAIPTTMRGTDNAALASVVGALDDAAADGDVTDADTLMSYQKQLVGNVRDNGRGGQFWYLDSGASADGAGTSWDDAWDTMAEAVAGASNYDTILVADGSTYDNAATINITQTGLHIIGTGAKEPNFAKAMVYGPSDGHFITINAHEVWIDNISFVGPANNYDAIRVGTTGEFFKIKITNCKFDLTNGEYCIKADDTNDCPDMVIENNLFRSFATAGVYLNTTRAKVLNNIFLVMAGTTGIVFVPDGGGRPDSVIKGNVIRGSNSTDTGISFSNTPTEALLTVVGNKVINCATPVTLAKYTSWYDGNYWGVDDANYHPGWGRADCEKRGANGRIFYVDINMATAGLDGLSWASAFDTVAAGLAAADTWIGTSGNRAWAKRCTVFVCADGETEALTAGAEKTDLVGVGYDIGAFPKLTCNFTIGSAVNGFRIFNLGLIAATTAPFITVPSGMHGFECHGVHCYPTETVVPTAGIQITNSRDSIFDGVHIYKNPSDGRCTVGLYAVGTDVGRMLIKNSYIEGVEAFDVNSNVATADCARAINTIFRATNLCVDDNSALFEFINCRFITDSASGDVNGNTIVDWNAALATGCQAVSSDSNGPIPNVTALA